MSVTATVFETLKRVSENVTRVYQSGVAHGFAEIENIEVGLDNIIAIQEELIGVITFTVIGNTLNAIQGMTWSEFVESEYNIYGYYISGDYVICGVHTSFFVANTDGSYVLPSDVIQDGASYTHG